MWWYHSTKTAKNLLDNPMHGQLMDAPCVAPSKVTQKIVAVLLEWYHHIVLTMSFKLVSFFTLILFMAAPYKLRCLPRRRSMYLLSLTVSCRWVVDWTAGAARHWLDLGYKERCDAPRKAIRCDSVLWREISQQFAVSLSYILHLHYYY